MRTVLVLLLCLGLVGCVTTDYYTNPNSPGYYQQTFGGLCESCGRVFAMSGAQLQSLENIQCPYCGAIQNARMASNRYTYAKQQQDAQNLMGFANTMHKSIQENIERDRQFNQMMTQEILRGLRPQPSQPSQPYYSPQPSQSPQPIPLERFKRQPTGTFYDPFHIKVED